MQEWAYDIKQIIEDNEDLWTKDEIPSSSMRASRNVEYAAFERAFDCAVRGTSVTRSYLLLLGARAETLMRGPRVSSLAYEQGPSRLVTQGPSSSADAVCGQGSSASSWNGQLTLDERHMNMS